MFKNRNLPKDATPWGREVESRIEFLEEKISVLKSASTVNSAQLQTTATNTAALWNNVNNTLPTISKNGIINGAMDIWQRATTTSSTGYSCVDRWLISNSAGTLTASQNISFVPPGFVSSLRLTSTSNSTVGIKQIIESNNATLYADHTVTFSALVASSSVPELFDLKLMYSTLLDPLSTDSSWFELTPVKTNINVVTANSFYQISAVFNVPANAETLMASISASIEANAVVHITGVQLEIGKRATDFTRAGLNFGTELALCQRYYIKFAPTANLATYGVAIADTATSAVLSLPFPVQMRIAPTILENLAAATYYYLRGSANVTISAIGMGSSSQWFGVVSITATVTAGNAYGFRNFSTPGGYLAFSAELN